MQDLDHPRRVTDLHRVAHRVLDGVVRGEQLPPAASIDHGAVGPLDLDDTDPGLLDPEFVRNAIECVIANGHDISDAQLSRVVGRRRGDLAASEFDGDLSSVVAHMTDAPERPGRSYLELVFVVLGHLRVPGLGSSGQ